MYGKTVLNICLLVVAAVECVSPNHWTLKEGRITHKIDSPFFMREPHNLAAFLNQIQLSENVESSYLQLLRHRQQIVDHLRFSVQFGEDLVGQAKCAMEYYMLEKRMSYLTFSPAYLRRLDLPTRLATLRPVSDSAAAAAEPVCENPDLLAGPCAYDHLRSLKEGFRNRLQVETAEEMQMSGVASSDMLELMRRLAMHELQKHGPRRADGAGTTDLWRAYLLSSYYWRMRGQAPQAAECARLSVVYASRTHKDMALLSLASIVLHSGHLDDAEVLLNAAVEHRPDVAENHIVLGSTLAMKHDFNGSVQHFDEAERLDPSLLPRTQPVRKFMSCLDNLTKKTTKMYSYVEYMKDEVKEFKKMKYQITQKHEQLMQQQVPLNARYVDKMIDGEDLLRRGQYCSTRHSFGQGEPVLFCDFYSDIQMRLQSKEVDVDSLEIETLERDLKLTSEAVMRQVTAEMRKQMHFEQSQAATKGQEPFATLPVGGGAQEASKEK